MDPTLQMPPPPSSSLPAPSPRFSEEDLRFAERWGIPLEAIPTVQDLVIDDGKPVDNTFSEKNMRLLTEPLFSSWPGPGEGRPFVALANVGLFYVIHQPPIVPDVMLAVDVKWPPLDLSKKETLSYFVWYRGKLPDVTIEIVSNRKGGEDTDKFDTYAWMGVPYYVIFDPEDLLGGGVLRAFARDPGGKYRAISPEWLEGVGLGLRLWEGKFEDDHKIWLRWHDRQGNPIPTGAERADVEHRRAEEANLRAQQAIQEAERLRAKLRELGVEPPA